MLSLNTELNKQLTEFASLALENRSLTDRERTLTVLAAAIALEDTASIKPAIVAAKQAGVANEEIGHVSSIVIALQSLRLANLGVVSSPATNGQTSTTQSTCCR
jgi:alkylhydroperoxidase/carboxymuconolactone decarboxylase family protein YurZ